MPITVIINRGGTLLHGGVNKFPGGREPSCAVEHRKFLNWKVFRLIYLFKVRGAWNTCRTIT